MGDVLNAVPMRREFRDCADVGDAHHRGGSGNFCPSTGTGDVAYKKPDYAHALSRSDTTRIC